MPGGGEAVSHLGRPLVNSARLELVTVGCMHSLLRSCSGLSGLTH